MSNFELSGRRTVTKILVRAVLLADLDSRHTRRIFDRVHRRGLSTRTCGANFLHSVALDRGRIDLIVDRRRHHVGFRCRIRAPQDVGLGLGPLRAPAYHVGSTRSIGHLVPLPAELSLAVRHQVVAKVEARSSSGAISAVSSWIYPDDEIPIGGTKEIDAGRLRRRRCPYSVVGAITRHALRQLQRSLRHFLHGPDDFAGPGGGMPCRGPSDRSQPASLEHYGLASDARLQGYTPSAARHTRLLAVFTLPGGAGCRS